MCFNATYIKFKDLIPTTLVGIVPLLGANFEARINWIILFIIGVSFYLFLHFKLKPSLDNQTIQHEGGKPSEDSRYISSVSKEVQQPYIVSDPTNPIQVNVENAIRRFKPRARYRYEIDYQNELYNWLSREFPVQYEVQTGSSRPDLIIKNIAIEIKGPTGNRELDTLTTKFLKYSNHYPHFIIVLFDCNFSEGHFNEIYNGIRKFAPNVIIIRK